MLQEMVEVLNEGESNGNNMIIQIKPPSGLEIVGLPTKISTEESGTWDPLGIMQYWPTAPS